MTREEFLAKYPGSDGPALDRADVEKPIGVPTRDWRPGEQIIVDGKLWAKCSNCRRIIRVDGWLGGLHVCE